MTDRGTIEALTLLKLPVWVAVCVQKYKTTEQNTVIGRSRFTNGQIRVSVSLTMRKRRTQYIQQINPMNQKAQNEDPGLWRHKPMAQRARAMRDPALCGKSRALQISIANERSLSQCVFTRYLQGLL